MMVACTTHPMRPIPTIAAALHAVLAMRPLVPLRLGQHVCRVLEHVGNRTVQVLRESLDQSHELRRAPEIHLGCAHATRLRCFAVSCVRRSLFARAWRDARWVSLGGPVNIWAKLSTS